MSSYAQAATIALSETGGMNDESERRQGMGMSKGARAETYLHNREGVPTKGRKAASPSRLSPNLLEVILRSANSRSTGRIAKQQQQKPWTALPAAALVMVCSARKQQLQITALLGSSGSMTATGSIPGQ